VYCNGGLSSKSFFLRPSFPRDLSLHPLSIHLSLKLVESFSRHSRQSPEMFTYRRLDTYIKEIRLLLVLPALQQSSRIKCWVVYRPAGKAPAYYALSYTWGIPTEKKEIFLDGEPFWVQPNLESALCHFRSRWVPHLI
jgi:hypothetical protein